jgi:anaerobic magnesium-protoporphyrin IX monomethyl ester cyclase
MNKNISNKKVLIVHPPFNELKFGSEWQGTNSLMPPIGLMYLGSSLLKAGYKVKFLDLNVDKISEKEFLEELKKSDYLLISCYTLTLENAKEIIRIAKENSNAQIICGGPYCKITGNYVPGSDLTVVGEAEDKIVEILERLPSKNFKNIPGMIYVKNGKIIRNPGQLMVENIDKSENAGEILAKQKNYGYLLNHKMKIAGIMTSRGCPFNCTYCTFKDNLTRKVRKRSIDSVIKELKELQKRNYEFVVFLDDNFLIDKERVNKLIDRIIKEKIKLKIIVQGRVDSADPEFYKKLRKAGVVIIMFGIENPNQDVLDFYKKGTSIEQIKKAVFQADRAGIINLGFLILGSPLEKKEHFEKLKKFVKEAPLDFIKVTILIYSEGSELWEKSVKAKKIKRNEIAVYANENLSNYTFEQWKDMRGELIKTFYNRPAWFTRAFFKCLKLGLLPTLLGLLWSTRKNIFERAKEPYSHEVEEERIKV